MEILRLVACCGWCQRLGSHADKATGSVSITSFSASPPLGATPGSMTVAKLLENRLQVDYVSGHDRYRQYG
jgi:hypothetical protein